MAYTVKGQRHSRADQLRDDLSRAEGMVVQLEPDNVEAFLQLLDRIEERFAQLEAGGLDLRAERTRQESLHSKVVHEAGSIVSVAGHRGGMEALRAANPPATSFWWHLEKVVAARRRRFLRRLATVIGGIVLVIAVVYVALTYVFPPDPNTLIAADAISRLQELTAEGKWEEANRVILDAKARMSTDDVELLIWEGVVAEKLGDPARAAAALNRAQALLPEDRKSYYWWNLGTVKLAAGDRTGARAAGEQALAVDPEDPQAYFLLGNVAEAEGDISTAIDDFERTFELAADTNPQLAVIARVRMGNLMQLPSGQRFTPTPGG